MKVITGPDTRWSYANVWEPKSINGGTPKYSVSLIISKSDTKTIAKIEAAIEAAYKEGEAKLKGNGKSVPALSVIKTPLRDGDMERPDDPAYANAYFVNANAISAPGIVDADRNPILTRSEVYSGVYGRASISFYAFNSSGNKGIACGLNNLQKIRDGEPLGGKASAESDFASDEDGTGKSQSLPRLHQGCRWESHHRSGTGRGGKAHLPGIPGGYFLHPQTRIVLTLCCFSFLPTYESIHVIKKKYQEIYNHWNIPRVLN